jgi:hypothetical protein
MQLRDLAAAAACVFNLKNKRLPLRPIMGCTAFHEKAFKLKMKFISLLCYKVGGGGWDRASMRTR